jgi:hypothetical protein
MTDHTTYPQTQTAQKQRGRTSRGIAVLAAVALLELFGNNFHSAGRGPVRTLKNSKTLFPNNSIQYTTGGLPV